jgi:hypothetical protein
MTMPLMAILGLAECLIFAYQRQIFLVSLIPFFLCLFVLYLSTKWIAKIFEVIISRVNLMSQGQVVERINNDNDELPDILVKTFDKLVDGQKGAAEFARAISGEEFGYVYTPLGPNDDLGHSLLGLREQLLEAKEGRKILQRKEEKVQWANQGHAKFSEMLNRNFKDLKSYGYAIISELVNYLGVEIGGFYLVNDAEEVIELTAAFAYDRQKFVNKKIAFGEGLVGACYLEKKSIFISKIPDGYLKIASGLGYANPSGLFLVPLKLKINNVEIVCGVIELASVKDILAHKREFVEKLAETIASAISSLKLNAETARLLKESQAQMEKAAQQEEELRQNMEEMQATQEEYERKFSELQKENEELREKLKEKKD